MPGPFDIRAATNTVTLRKDGGGEASFTATNVSGRTVRRGRADIEVVQGDAATQEWLSLMGESEREFAIATTEQYTVRIQVPPNSPAGSYTFRLNLVDVDNTDEGFSEGQLVTFVVPEPEQPPPPFPWWWIAAAAAAVVLIVVGVLLWIFVFSKATMPNVIGDPFVTAEARVEEAGLVVGETAEVVEAIATPGEVLFSTPPANARVNRDSEVGLIVALAPTPTATSTPTATPTSTATGTATPTPTSTSTPPPLGSLVDHFVGTWNNIDDSSPMRQLIIQKVDNSTASIKVIASQPVPDWGTVEAFHSGTRLVATWKLKVVAFASINVDAVLEREPAPVAVLLGSRLRAAVTYTTSSPLIPLPAGQARKETYVFEQPVRIIGPAVSTLVPGPSDLIIQPTQPLGP